MANLLGEATEGVNGAEAAAVGPSDGSGAEEVEEAETNGRKGKKKKSQTGAKQREAARAKMSAAKQALAEHRRLDEEVNKLERRLEGIERDFRKLFGAIRVKPMGKDRFHNRIWWFDGMGSASLLGSGGSVQYGTGRVFVQGASEFDVDLLGGNGGEVMARRREEEGEEGILGVGEWAVYDTIEEVGCFCLAWAFADVLRQVDEFVGWLNPKGVRELALKNALTKWWTHIAPGMRKRASVYFVHLPICDSLMFRARTWS